MKMKNVLCLTVVICLKIIEAKINIDITAGSSVGEVIIEPSGLDLKVVSDNEINLFKITDRKLKEALKKHYGTKPSNIYVKSPTPWGDLYKKNHWEQVTRVLTIKSARVKSVSKKPVIVMSHDFENYSNRTVKVNTGISQTVQNSVTTSWSRNNEITVSQEIEYGVNVYFEKATATTGISYSSSFGRSEEKSESVTVGSSSSMETELGPGQTVSSVLSANRGYLEVEVVYKAMLRGNVAVNFRRKVRDHHFWGPTIQDVMESGGLNNEITTTQIIKVGYYSDASLKVYDKSTGLPF